MNKISTNIQWYFYLLIFQIKNYVFRIQSSEKIKKTYFMCKIFFTDKKPRKEQCFISEYILESNRVLFTK